MERQANGSTNAGGQSDKYAVCQTGKAHCEGISQTTSQSSVCRVTAGRANVVLHGLMTHVRQRWTCRKSLLTGTTLASKLKACHSIAVRARCAALTRRTPDGAPGCLSACRYGKPYRQNTPQPESSKKATFYSYYVWLLSYTKGQ
jgi:hypothetical protein